MSRRIFLFYYKTFVVSLFIAILLSIAALPIHATMIIDTYQDYDGQVTSGWYATAQTIVATTDNILVNYTFGLEGRATPGFIEFAVFEWGTTGPVGSSLFSTEVEWSTIDNVEISGINLLLNTGDMYGMVVDLIGFGGQSVFFNTNRDSYDGGNGWWRTGGGTWYEYSDYNHVFLAEFESTPVPEPATLGLLLLGGLARLRRRR